MCLIQHDPAWAILASLLLLSILQILFFLIDFFICSPKSKQMKIYKSILHSYMDFLFKYFDRRRNGVKPFQTFLVKMLL